MKKLTLALWALVVALAPLGASQGADCNEWDGLSHKMHWVQYPDADGRSSMAVSLARVLLADDFVCTATGPIRDIHIWGSFQSGHVPEGGPDGLTFELTIYAFNEFVHTHPGARLWTRVFGPGQYTYVRGGLGAAGWGAAGWYDPVGDDTYLHAADRGDLFRYDFCIEEDPFLQEEGQVYWLAVRDLSANPSAYWFGWNNTPVLSDWGDDAVYLDADGHWLTTSYPPDHTWAWWPLDLAFAIGDGGTAPKHDLGDAPDNSNSTGDAMTAYPGVTANFPTVYRAGSPPWGPIHLRPRDRFYLGDAVSLENEADIGYDEDVDGDTGLPENNLSPAQNWRDHDHYDDGLVDWWHAYFPFCRSTTLDYRVTVTDPAARSAYVNIWCDWNHDGDWDDTVKCLGGPVPEWVVQNDTPAFAGAGAYVFTSSPFACPDPAVTGIDDTEGMWVRITIAEQQYVPTIILPQDPSARARIFQGGGPEGGYQYGETEDYYIRPCYDWGDAPDYQTVRGYPTLKIHNGARHVITGPWLGAGLTDRDCESDGQPDDHALGDDNMGDDEDGVSIPPMIPGLSTDATVVVDGGGGMVQIWVDFNADRAWSAEEKVLDGFLPDGIHVFSFPVPDNAVVDTTFARARISTAGHLNPDGPAADGEVEDHEVQIVTAPPTIMPGAVTTCPVVETTCPVTETYCPAEQTKCPPLATYCPAEQTKCPTRQTYCPTDPTKCPPGPTYCPAEQTKCPPEDTKCPTSSTKCPESLTTCPLTVTQCQSVATECPAVLTYCPPEDTKCPPTSLTKCPAKETQCPPVNTQCPVKETYCPSTATECRVVDTQCPAKATRCPPTGLTTCPVCGPGTLRSDAEEAAVFGVSCPIVETLCPTIGEYLAMAEARQ